MHSTPWRGETACARSLCTERAVPTIVHQFKLLSRMPLAMLIAPRLLLEVAIRTIFETA